MQDADLLVVAATDQGGGADRDGRSSADQPVGPGSDRAAPAGAGRPDQAADDADARGGSGTEVVVPGGEPRGAGSDDADDRAGSPATAAESARWNGSGLMLSAVLGVLVVLGLLAVLVLRGPRRGDEQ